jgi:hypothetical protein
MHPRSSKLRLAYCLLSALLLATLGVTIGASRQAPQSQQQRPRKVGTNQNTTNPPAQQPAGSPTPGEEVDEGDVVRVETQLVSVPAVVTDRSGRPMAGLRLDNFTLLEDGKPQHLTNFATTETPFEIALLLDTSGSTRNDLGLIRDAATAFIRALRAGDRVAIVAFKNMDREKGAAGGLGRCPVAAHRQSRSITGGNPGSGEPVTGRRSMMVWGASLMKYFANRRATKCAEGAPWWP